MVMQLPCLVNANALPYAANASPEHFVNKSAHKVLFNGNLSIKTHILTIYVNNFVFFLKMMNSNSLETNFESAHLQYKY